MLHHCSLSLSTAKNRCESCPLFEHHKTAVPMKFKRITYANYRTASLDTENSSCNNSTGNGDGSHMVATRGERQHSKLAQTGRLPVSWSGHSYPMRPHHVALHEIDGGRSPLALHVEEALNTAAAIVAATAPGPSAPVAADGRTVNVSTDDTSLGTDGVVGRWPRGKRREGCIALVVTQGRSHLVWPQLVPGLAKSSILRSEIHQETLVACTHGI